MRAVVTLVARYRSPTTFEYANEACFDISVGGMFIKSAAPAPAGTLLKLECETDSSADAKIRGVARVVWLRREANEHGPSGMGVKFVKLEAGSRELIENLVQRLADAGVQARSVSAAPETQLAAAEAMRGTGKVQLVQSTPPAAAPEAKPAAEPATRADAETIAARTEPEADETSPQIAAASAPRSEPPPPEAAPQPIAARTAVQDKPSEPELPESRPSVRPTTGSTRPPAPKPSRFGWKIWVLGIVLVLIAIALADRRRASQSEPTEVTPEAESKAAPPAVAPPAAAAAEPAAPSPSGQVRQYVPAATAEAPPAAEPPAAAAAAAEVKPAAEPAAPAAPAPAAEAAEPSGPMYPVKPGAKDYLIEFVSRPNAAEVTVDEKVTLTTPHDLHVGAMPERMKVTAKKAGYQSSSIWLQRTGFEAKDGKMVKRVYLTLKADGAAP